VVLRFASRGEGRPEGRPVLLIDRDDAVRAKPHTAVEAFDLAIAVFLRRKAGLDVGSGLSVEPVGLALELDGKWKLGDLGF
jgi:hypothetical protein